MVSDEQPLPAELFHAVSSAIIALREGKLQAAAFPPDCTTQAEVDRRRVVIPARFWRTLLDHEIAETFKRPPEQALDAGLCIRLWECLRRKGQPPTGLALAVSRRDVDQLWPGGRRPE